MKIFAFAALLILGGCSNFGVKEFAKTGPEFRPEKFFDGRVQAWGILEDGSGDPTKTFSAVDAGRLEGQTVTIDQVINFSDGDVQKRSWKLTRVDEHHYEGAAPDIVGKAKGELYGNALVLDYTVALNPSNPFTHVHLKQWLYLQEGGEVVLSRTTISKLGIVLARIAESVRRVTGPAKNP